MTGPEKAREHSRTVRAKVEGLRRGKTTPSSTAGLAANDACGSATSYIAPSLQASYM